VKKGEYYTEILYLMGQNRIVSVQSNMEYNLPRPFRVEILKGDKTLRYADGSKTNRRNQRRIHISIDRQEGLKALKNTTPQSRVV
jgi:hypothetical protein